MSFLDRTLEKGLLPDFVIRAGINHLLARKLKDENRGGVEAQQKALMDFVRELKSMPIAVKTREANEQHYEVPTEFFKYVLGPRMKYSSGLWPTRHTTFEESEEVMLALSCERAQLENGQRVLELGCGWGSLTLWMAVYAPALMYLFLTKVTGIKATEEHAVRSRGEDYREYQRTTNAFFPWWPRRAS